MRRVFALIIVFFLCVGVWFSWAFFAPPLVRQPQKFIIEKGQGLNEVAANLKKAGLINSKYLFEFYALAKGKQGSIKAGAYELWGDNNLPEILEILVSGRTSHLKLTLIEGWNLKDIAVYLEDTGFITAQDFLRLAESPAEDFVQGYAFLSDKPKNLGLGGYIFPDTYLLDAAQGLESFLKKALDNFDRKLTPAIREEIKRQGQSIFEVVTMASLLEKEVQSFEDRQIVAGILWKRLESHIPLQVDATVTYLTGKKTTRVSRDETQIDSPYNTYKYQGLPLGPICNPGLDSIKAAVYPKESPFWYYLSAPDGATIFSRTLDEHNAAKDKYLRGP